MQSGQREIKVLHVDDEPDFLLVTQHNLEKKYANFSVDTTTSAEEGITLLKSGNYDVVVSDYQMPGMDGLELLQTLRASGDKIPFIMFTGRGREEVAIEALNKGANHYLHKGGDIASLYQTLAHVIIELVERKWAEEKVVEIKKEHQLILDALPLNVFHINRKSEFVHVNKALAERYGLKPEEFKGKTSGDLFPDVGEAYLKSDKVVFESGAREIGTIRKIVTPQGEKWVRLDKVPLKDVDGTVTGLIGFELDITAQKKAEEGLRESEDKYRNLVERANDGICIIQDALVEYANSRLVEWSGYTEEEIICAPFTIFVAPEEIPKVVDYYKRRVAGEAVPSLYETVLQEKSGGKMDAELNAGIIMYHGKPANLVFVRDISERKRTAEALRESERKHQILLDSVPVGIFYIDADSRFVHVNKALAERYGMNPEDFKGKTSRDLFPEVAEDYIKSDKEVLESGEPQIGTIRRINTPQGVRWVRLDKVPLKDDDGHVTDIIGFELDVTERKRIEDALQESELEHQTVLDTVPVGIFHIDADSRFVHVNKALAELFGMKPEDFKGKTSRELFPDVGEEYIESDKEIFESGVPQSGVVKKLTTSEGVRWVRLDKVPLKDADGNITDVVGFELDITERMKTQDELRDAHKQLQDIIEFLPDATFVIDRDMKVIAWNRAIEEMTGIHKEDIIGKGDYEYALPFYGERRPILTDLVFSSNEEIESRYAHVGKKGSTLFAEVYSPFMYRGKGAYLWGIATPLFDRKGDVVGAIESIRDITDRKQTETERAGLLKELEAKNREMEHFAYTVSHDLRSPLITIQGFTTMLQEDFEQNKRESVESDLKYIENAVTRMGELLSGTLELSRIGRFVNPPEDVPFEEIVSDALEQTAGEIRAKDIEVSVAEHFPTVHVDRMRIVEVLVNLIANSIKYRGDPPHPKIELGYRVDGKDTVFFVKDNGIGIDESQQEKVFELFYQVDNSEAGTGAGLAIVKRIIEVHEGRIWIESETGKGTTVCFTLPVSP